MKYFIIHSGSDWDDKVCDLIQNWVDYSDNRSKFIVLNGTKNDWKDDAVAKIRQAEKVIYIIGQFSSASPNIKFELDVAMREKKPIYVYKLKDEYEVNSELNGYMKDVECERGDVDGEMVFSKKRNNIVMLEENNVKAVLQNDVNEILENLPGMAFDDPDTLLEQYKIYVKTSEDLVKRKQSVNSFYITLNSILLSAVISVLCAAGQLPMLGKVNVSWLVTIFAAFIGFVVCFSWVSVLNSYAALNSSKMKVITSIEQHLALNLFDTEWSFVTETFGNKPYKSFSQKEKFIAYLFGAIYVGLVILGITIAIVSALA